MSDDLEDQWDDLISAMRRKTGRVVPVIGPDLSTVPSPTHDAAPVPPITLHAQVAQELRDRYPNADAAPTDTGTWVLHRQVAAILERERGTAAEHQLRRRLARLLDAHSRKVPVPPALARLVAIPAFDLYVSLSSDTLLLRSLREADPSAQGLAYGIRSDLGGAPLDLPNTLQAKTAYQLFGSVDNELDFAMHEGDLLEYLARLQAGDRSTVNLLSRLRGSHLLFIGCGLPDWMGRPLLRLLNQQALNAKTTSEFMTGAHTAPQLAAFVSLFSNSTMVFPGSAAEFVEELWRRWQATSPPLLSPTHAGNTAALSARVTSATGKTVFVSYASEDAVAARAIADQLLTLGAQDVWFDKRKLRAGDDWSNTIGRAISACDYFLPVLSRQADARREGVFWEEWDEALRRKRRIADHFLLPTLVDGPETSRGSFQRIGKEGNTDAFFDRQLLMAPGGAFDAQAQQDLRALFNPPPGAESGA